MKKVLLVFISIFFLTQQSHAQFKRTFLNNYNSLHIQRLKVLDSDVGNMKLLSLHEGGSATAFKLKVSEINETGDLLSATDFSLNIPSASGKSVFISNGFETSTEYVFSLLIKSPSDQLLTFFKVSKTTGQVIQNFELPDTFMVGFVETQHINNELVTYMVKQGGGLYRTSISFSNLNTYYTELVDGSLTVSTGNSSYVNTKRSTELELIGGKELTVMSYQNYLKIYVRNSLNNFTPNTISGSNGSGIHLIPLSLDTLLACDAVSWYKLNSAAQVLASGSFTTGSNFVQHLIVKKPNGFYRLGKTGSSFLFENLDNHLNLLSSNTYPGIHFMNEFVSRQDQQILLGASTFISATFDINGNDKEAYQAFVHLIQDDQVDFKLPQEYQTSFTKDDIELNFSESSTVISGYYAFESGAKFKGNKRIAYDLEQVYTGITQNGDTVGKFNGGLFEFSRVGPYTANNLFNDVVESKYNRGFYVTKAMIEAHIDSIQSNSAGYVVPHGIREWPGNGDVSLGQSAQIAPYVDVNSNGIYEPMLGEYPIIYGDACFLQIWHDHPNLERPGGIETHNYAYTFDCDTTDTYSNAIFFKTKYISRENDFSRFSIGSFLDLDNGNPTDDYIGTHVELGMAYCYNGDLFDEPFGSDSNFKDTLPVQGFMVLKGNKMDSDGLDNPEDASPIGCTNGLGFNDGIIDNEYFTLERTLASSAYGGITIPDPQTAAEWERITNGFWPDGTPLFYGGNGNIFSGTTTNTKARFIFPGGSDTLFYGTDGINPGFDWTPLQTAVSSGPILPPTDYRIYASHGSRAFTQTDTIEFDYVYILYYDSTHATTSITEPLGGLFAKAEKIKLAYNQNAGPCGTNFNPIDNDLSVKGASLLQIGVYPNPTTGIIRFSGVNDTETSVVVYDGSGRTLKKTRIQSETDSIDLSDLQGNLFFVKIQQGQNIRTHKIIKY
ncbi:T9SS type A sorting domain-containing protein [Fluviicola chungangensis]|uniref:T9SS type A sorting domain-containing protein n=1 Tax=Fluviicola chungangensis TaxID=2597671 RepID=A0A556N0C7_9FLAO|nr:T9SS type A sorting domain-containing protein [Fluviicola chungangensis]TSJ45641.1 T9SS type A sorting domain-containing protein [Fluviicola chungangensis]